MDRDFRDHNTIFDGVAARFATSLSLTTGNRSERIQAELVSGTYFDTLGLTTALGRGIAPEDDLRPSAHPVAVPTYDYRQSLLHRKLGVPNQTVQPTASHDGDRHHRRRVSRLRPRARTPSCRP
jgi:hypothetical protein